MEVNKYIKKLKKTIQYYTLHGKYESALTSAKVLATLHYDYNQLYMDSDLEDALIKIRDSILEENKFTVDKECVLFYDGFGLDLRGWAASYVKALSSLGYYVIYACPSVSKGKIPHIESELDKCNSLLMYIDSNSSNISRAKKIDSLFKTYKPNTAFFYTIPSDVAAAIAFSNNRSTTRFQIDLTDHAYWIGVNAFDYAIECREMGASLALYERGIDRQRILKLDCAPYINREIIDEPFPFDVYNDKYVFTGGALYKTLGDANLLYYKTISYILDSFRDIKFLYAGSGDDTEILKLINEYPDRVFYIRERPDFFEIIKNSILYVNTYPMFGGLMMRYAALAHKVPITLKHDNDADGILIDQDKLGIEFDDYQKYLDEIHKLLSDEKYRKQQEDKVKNAVINENDFAENIKLLIEENRTTFHFDVINKLDTLNFRKEYKNRYSVSMLYKSFAKRESFVLIKSFPIEYFVGVFIKIKEKLYK